MGVRSCVEPAISALHAVTFALVWRCSYASLYQHPPEGRRTPEEESSFKRALDVMADTYASAVGTTVLQLKEIPSRPADYDGAICLYGSNATDDASVRKVLSQFGEIQVINFSDQHVIVRFETHAAALAAVQAGAPQELCEGISTLYNERSYNDDTGDGGRGWCIHPAASPFHASSPPYPPPSRSAPWPSWPQRARALSFPVIGGIRLHVLLQVLL